MTIRTVLIVGLALVFGVCAVLGVNLLLRSRTAVAAPREETVPAVIAAADIPRFGTVTADMVKVREFPKSYAPAGAAARV